MAAAGAQGCQAADDGGVQNLPVKVRKRPTECHRCHEVPPAVILHGRDGYCGECCVSQVGRRVRMEMGKNSQQLQHNQKVLLAHSGGARSCALLYLIHKFMQEEQKHPMRICPTVVYIDESLVWPPAAQAQPRPHFDPSVYPKSLGFDFIAVKLEDVFDPLADGPPGRPVLQAEAGAPETSRALLLQMLESLKTATAKEDLLRILRHRALARTARRHQTDTVMVGDCNDRLATAVLAAVSLGRGGSMSDVSSYAMGIGEGVTMLRPLRNASAREIAFLGHFAGIKAMPPPRLLDFTPSKSSIARLTQEFTAGLVADHATTARSVVRASDKMEMDESRVQGACALCGSPVEETAAALATRTAQRTRTSEMANDDLFRQCDGEPISVRPRLCYGCRNTLDEMNPERAVLPGWVFRTNAQETLSTYLLTENEDEP